MTCGVWVGVTRDWERLEEAPEALRTVGKSAELGQAQWIWFQGILGNIDAKVEGEGVVLAHTCHASWFLIVDRSINGSSSEQLAKEGTGSKNGLSASCEGTARPSAARAHSSASAAVVAIRSGGSFYLRARRKPSAEERRLFNIQVRWCSTAFRCPSPKRQSTGALQERKRVSSAYPPSSDISAFGCEAVALERISE
jgi:hypothetical protein